MKKFLIAITSTQVLNAYVEAETEEEARELTSNSISDNPGIDWDLFDKDADVDTETHVLTDREPSQWDRNLEWYLYEKD